MTFYAPNGQVRPIRLTEETRQFAWDSLNQKYGQEALANMAVSMDDLENYESMTKLERYDEAIYRIATQAPIRICPDEKLSGAATLGMAINHNVPATYGGKTVAYSISHLTIDFETVVKYGVNHIRAKAEAALQTHLGTEREPFARSCIHCLNCLDLWHQRYLDALASMPGYEANYRNLQKVPHEPASNFYEAVQSIWFVFAFNRLCGNWPGVGRLDVLLGDYLEQDLREGTITLNEAREILAHFFIKGCEWITGNSNFQNGSGDAQHYQNILLCGIDENGKEVTNQVTYLVLDVLEELGISDYPTSVRLNSNTDPKLLRRVAEVMRYGGGILAVYGEDTVIKSLTEYGYSLTEARKFANDGCWEVQVPGKTFFAYIPFDSLRVLQDKTLKGYAPDRAFATFEDLYAAYLIHLQEAVEAIYEDRTTKLLKPDFANQEWQWKQQKPCTVVSLFEQGCIESGHSYVEGGPIYNVLSPHIGGLADAVNALYVIKKLVYDEKKLPLEELMALLRNNWEDNEPLRQYVLKTYPLYGNDNDEVDALYARVLQDFSGFCRQLDGRCDYHFPAGVSTFGRQLEWAPFRMATPHGRRAHEVLAGNTSPTPGSDREGATAIIRSYCKADLFRLPTGAALDLKLLPSSVEGADGLEALVALMQGFVALGGFFMQPDVVDASVLHEAQEHPEDYQNLSVRVSGWNARFVTLCKEWQDMVIEQNEKK